MDRSERRSCGDKVKYESSLLANNWLTLLLWKGKLTEQHECYRCRYCRYWHHGRRPERRIA